MQEGTVGDGPDDVSTAGLMFSTNKDEPRPCINTGELISDTDTDSDWIDDDVLRSVDAFSQNNDDDDHGHERKLSRTELKLAENADQPIKGMVIYIIYTLLKSLSFLFAAFLYRRNPDLSAF